MSDVNTKLLLHFDGDFLDYSGNNHHPNTHGHFSFPAGKFSAGFKSNCGKLFVPDHSDFNFGSSDFTVDAWCYVSSSGNIGQYLFSVGSSLVAVYFHRSYRRVYLYLNGASGYSSDDIFPLDAWFHFALVRSGSTYTVYINGQSVYTRSYTDSLTGGDLEIGSYNYSNQIEAIDEFRISDIVRWSSSFTPPVAPYTDGVVTPPASDDSPDFLLHFNESFLDCFGETPQLNGCYGFEDGVFDKALRCKYGNLIFGNADALKFSTGDFTVDFRAKFDSSGSSYYIFDNGVPTSTDYFRMSLSGSELRFYCGTSTAQYTVNANITLGTWYHIAIVRTGNRVLVYVDGVLRLNFINTSNLNLAGNLYVGCAKDNESLYFRGLIDELCVTNGCAKWMTDFTPAATEYPGTTPADPAEPSSDFLLHFNESFLDCFGETPQLNGYYGFEEGKFDKAFRSKYGNLIFENADVLKFGTDDFTVDFWVKFELSGISYFIYDNGVPTTSDYFRMSLSGTELRFYCGSSAALYTVNANIALDTWYHIAIVRVGRALLVFVNGNLRFSGINLTNINSAGDLYIGSAKSGESSYFRGLIDEFRVIKGYAKWVTEFTPPDSEYAGTTPADPPVDTDCDLLLHFDNACFDSSGQNYPVIESDYFEFDEDGKYNQQAIFDGSKYLTAGDLANWSLDANFTIDFWMYLPTGYSTGRYIFSLGLRRLSLMTHSNNALRLYLNNLNIYLPDNCVQSDTWQHIAVTRVGIRSQKQVKEFTNSFGLEKLYKITGHSPHTLFSVFKLIWMIENSPDIVRKANKFLCFGDLLCYRLTGQAVTSHNLAARTMLFDVKKMCWSDEILGAINIDRSILPKSMPSGQPAGQLLPAIAEELGLSRDAVVNVGGHDQSCGALGVGITGVGKAAYSIGTVECITPAFGGCVLNDTMQQSNLATYPFVIDGLYTTVAFNITGGNLLRWYRDSFAEFELQQGQKTGKDVYDIILSNIPDEPTNIFVQPHFVSTGTPYFDPNPTGAIIGLSLNNSKGEVVKALLEGVTYEMKLNLRLLEESGIKVNELYAFGGGAKSDKWLQIKADILGVPIHSIATSEAGCLGASLLAAQAIGDINSIETVAEKNSRPLKTFEPDIENMKRYDQRYEIYSDIYQTIKPIGEKINKLTN